MTIVQMIVQFARANPIFCLGIMVALEQAVSTGTLQLTNAVPATWIPAVTAWCTILAFIGNAVMTGLAAPGMSKPPATPALKVLSWFALPLALVLLMGGPAGAQDRNVAPGRQITLPIPLSRPDGPSPGAQSLLDKPFQDLANFIGDDIDAAITLSTKIPSLQDGNGQQCLMALKTFGEVVAAHPAPLTFKIASDLEAFRLKQMAINRLCSNQSCTVVFADITQTITALSPMPLPIPSLHDLCSKVPTITVVAPVPTTQP